MPHFPGNRLQMAITLLVLGASSALPPDISSDTRFCYRPSKPQGMLRPEGLRKFRNINDHASTRTCDLPACSIAPQPSALPRTPSETDLRGNIGAVASGPP
jgi:hypothetical protein